MVIANNGWYHHVYRIEGAFRNDGGEDVSIGPTISWSLVTADGSEYSAKVSDESVHGTLAPGKSIPFTVYFDIPENKVPVKLICSWDHHDFDAKLF